MATTAQAAASRVNGALSHGPTSEDAALYEAHLAQFRDRYQPVGDQELALFQSLADTHWRLARIPSLEQIELRALDLVPGLFHDWAADKLGSVGEPHS